MIMHQAQTHLFGTKNLQQTTLPQRPNTGPGYYLLLTTETDHLVIQSFHLQIWLQFLVRFHTLLKQELHTLTMNRQALTTYTITRHIYKNKKTKKIFTNLKIRKQAELSALFNKGR